VQIPYRRDIDGLRAIAVSAVVLYHFGLAGLDGGFVGVDIFFVLSGYLIGGLLWREQEASQRIDLWAFYTRRIRRLAPAFVVMAVVTAICTWFILLPFEFREFGKQLIAATVYLSNVFFWREAGYFDAASEEKPLLHTWSLSVEEQFYIVLPLLLIGLYRLAPRARVPALTVAALASVLACILITSQDSVSTFYLFHFRAWELLAGVLLAIHVSRGWVPSQPLALSASGVMLLLYAFTQTDAGAGFPGWQAIVPVVGTMALLAGGLKNHAITRVLSWKLPVGVGLISYSLYLWHWPIFVLSTYVQGDASNIVETLGWIAVSVLVACLSWRFVEQPFRTNGPGPKSLVAMALCASLGMLAFGGWLFKSDGMPERFDESVRPHIAASGDFLQDFSRCYVPDNGSFMDVEICPIGPEGAPDVLVWGDSHLRAFANGISQAALEADRPGLLIWHAGCPPLFDITKQESYATPAQDAACAAANGRIGAALADLNVKDILLVGRWSYYATGTGIGRDVQNTIKVTPSFADAVPATIAKLNETGARLHVLRQVPEVPSYDSRIFARALAHGRAQPGSAEVTLADAQGRNAAGSTPFLDQAQINWIDPWPALCADGVCAALPEGRPYYFDNNHITNKAAVDLRVLFRPVFER